MTEDWLQVLTRGSRFIFHGNAEARAAASTAWGAAFAEEPCRARVLGERATLWLGPDEYLLWDGASGADPATATAAIAAAIEQALGGLPHALVDISHRQIGLQVSGAHAADILCGGCALDLSIEQFAIGACTRTAFAKADIVLWRTATDTFRLEVWRSFTAYVESLLREIAVDFDAAG